MRNDFRGAQVTQSAIGDNATVNVHNAAGPVRSLPEELADLRRALAAQPDSRDRQAALVELDGLSGQLAAGTPDPAIVRTRWERVQARALLVLGTVAELSAIGSLVNDLFG